VRRSWVQHGRLQCKICAQNTGNEKQQNVLLFVEELKKNIEKQVAWFLAELRKAGKGCGKKDKRNQCRTELLRGYSAPPLNTPPSSSVERTFFLSSCTWFLACMCKRRQNNNGGFFSQKQHAKEMQSSCSVDNNLHHLYIHPCHSLSSLS
jgi:hypothetical protein